MKIFNILLTAVAAFATIVASAQAVIKTDAGDLKLRIMGRTNFDAATYVGGDLGKNKFGHYYNGVQMNDTRLGVLANFDENWTAKAEICFANRAVSFRDLYIGYKLSDNSSLQLGNFFMPYGAKILGLQYKFVEDATVDNAFCPVRKIGFAYFYTSDPFNFTAGVFSDGNVDAKALNQGYTIAAKAIFRPVLDENTVLHFGVAPMFTDSPNAPSFTGIVPTTVHTNALVSSGAVQNDNYWRFEGEAIFISGRFYAEAHCMASVVNVPIGDNYTAVGEYVQTSFLLKGEKQNYNKKSGLATSASPKSLELLARYDHLKLDDDVKLNDVTVGLNYFFNKNLNAKLNWAYGKPKGADDGYSFVQLRMQFSF